MFSVCLSSAALTFRILNFLDVTTIVPSELFSTKLGTNYHFQVCSNEGPFFLPWIPIWPSIIKRIYFLENYAAYYNIHFLNQTVLHSTPFASDKTWNKASTIYCFQVCSSEGSGPILILSIQFRNFLQRES